MLSFPRLFLCPLLTVSFGGFNGMVFLNTCLAPTAKSVNSLSGDLFSSSSLFSCHFSSWICYHFFYHLKMCMFSLGGRGACVWSHVHPTEFPSSYVHFLNLHSINDFILFSASLSFQFLGLTTLLFWCLYLVAIYQTSTLANLAAKSMDNSVPVYISPSCPTHARTKLFTLDYKDLGLTLLRLRASQIFKTQSLRMRSSSMQTSKPGISHSAPIPRLQGSLMVTFVVFNESWRGFLSHRLQNTTRNKTLY